MFALSLPAQRKAAASKKFIGILECHFFFFFNHFKSKEVMNKVLSIMLSIHYGRHAAFNIAILDRYIKFM